MNDIELLKGSAYFDPIFYRERYPDVAQLDPWVHYLECGGVEGRWPSADFDPEAYSRAYPDVREAGGNPLVHFLRHGVSNGQSATTPGVGRAWGATPAMKDLVRRELHALAELEPDLMSDGRLYDLDALSSALSMPRNLLSANWRRVWESLGRDVKHLVFVPWLTRGGADLAAVNVFKALQLRVGLNAVALVVTDQADTQAADWLPEGSRFLSLAETDAALSPDDRRTLVERLIWALRPDSVFNVNSRACWEAMALRGQALSRMTQLNALLFCRDFAPDGRPSGYSDTHFRPSLPHLHRVYFDTRSFMAELVTQYGLTPCLSCKLHYLPQPAAAPRNAYHPVDGSVRPRILWIGRFVAQKNMALLARIVEEGTDFDFDVWGGGDAKIEQQFNELAVRRSNLRLRGMFASLDELPLSSYAAFLFTSHYEGMPTIILNIAATGMPIVATVVGGVGEIVDEQTGWPIVDRERAEPYLAALTQISLDAEQVARKRHAMSERIVRERSQETFEQELFN